MKINDEMFLHILRWHMEYETNIPRDHVIRDLFVMIKYLFDEIEKLKE